MDKQNDRQPDRQTDRKMAKQRNVINGLVKWEKGKRENLKELGVQARRG